MHLFNQTNQTLDFTFLYFLGNQTDENTGIKQANNRFSRRIKEEDSVVKSFRLSLLFDVELRVVESPASE